MVAVVGVASSMHACMQWTPNQQYLIERLNRNETLLKGNFIPDSHVFFSRFSYEIMHGLRRSSRRERVPVRTSTRVFGQWTDPIPLSTAASRKFIRQSST